MANKLTSAAEALSHAHVVLMEHELLSRSQNPDLFRLVNNQYNALQNWHDQYTGWRIRRSPAVIRLIRVPTSLTPGYALRNLQNPRDVACFIWALWYAENRLVSGRGNESQFLMSDLAGRLEEHSATGYLAPQIAPLDFKRLTDRYSLSRALKALHDLDGLHLVDGSSEEWVEQKGQENALWEFTESARSLILALDSFHLSAVGNWLAGNPHTLSPVMLPSAEKLSPLQRAWRTLLLGPVLFQYDDPAAFAALREHAETIGFELGNTFGWQLDLRQEYGMVIRASGTGLGPISLLNLAGAADQAALLCCDAIRQKVKSGLWHPDPVDGCFVVAASEIADIFRRVREQHGQRWGSTARKASFPELLNEVYATLRQAGLMRGPDKDGNVLVLPTVARFAITYSRDDEPTAAPSSVQVTLFEAATTGKAADKSARNGANDGYSTREAAQLLGIHELTLLDWLKSGKIKGDKPGRFWVIEKKEVERIKKERQTQAQKPTAPPPKPTAKPARMVEVKSQDGENYTVRQVADMLGVVPWTVLRWIQQGRLPASNNGSIWLIPMAEAEKLINNKE